MNLEAGVLQISFERSYHKTWKSYSTPDNYGLLERVFQCLAWDRYIYYEIGVRWVDPVFF